MTGELSQIRAIIFYKKNSFFFGSLPVEECDRVHDRSQYSSETSGQIFEN